MSEQFMQVEKDYLRAMLTPESHCEDCPFDGMRCWTFREERGYFLCDAVYRKVWRLLGLAQ
jgi:hypothetical protein